MTIKYNTTKLVNTILLVEKKGTSESLSWE